MSQTVASHLFLSLNAREAEYGVADGHGRDMFTERVEPSVSVKPLLCCTYGQCNNTHLPLSSAF